MIGPARQLLCTAPLLLALTAAAAGTLDYRPVLDRPIDQVVLQPDGKALVAAGLFATGPRAVNGELCGTLCRLNPDGSLDSGFAPQFEGDVRAVLLQPDGRIVIGGSFRWFDGQPDQSLARLHADGSVDHGFIPPVLSSSIFGSVSVLTLASAPGGRILVAGDFNMANGLANQGVIRLNANGTLDSGFQADLGLPEPPDDTLLIFPFSLTVQPGGSVLIAGSSAPDSTFSMTPFVARVAADGAADPAFQFPQGGNDAVITMALADDGHILIGGNFIISGDGMQRDNLARLQPDGSIDIGFAVNVNDEVRTIRVLDDGRILLGGAFSTVNGFTASRAARLLPAGGLDQSWNPQVTAGIVGPISGRVAAIAPEAGGNVLIGGDFIAIGGQTQSYLARVDVDGSLLRQPDPEADDAVLAMAALPDRGVLIGGRFSAFGESPASGLARLLPDGRPDPEFAIGADDAVHAIAVQPDGAAIVAGEFTLLGGQDRQHIGRLRADGTLDPAFAPILNGAALALTLDGQDRILIGGDFQTIGLFPRQRIARLEPDGSPDPGFNPGTDGEVLSIAVDPDGNVLVAGRFSIIDGHAQPHLARLVPDGSLDAGFLPDIDGEVLAVQALVDGSVIIGGDFTKIDGVARRGLARLRPDGTLDPLFDTALNGSVRALTVFSDANLFAAPNRLIVIGGFTEALGQSRSGVARIRFVLDNAPIIDSQLIFNVVGSAFSMLALDDERLLIGGDFSFINGQARTNLAIGRTAIFGFQSMSRGPGAPGFVSWKRVGFSALTGAPVLELSLDGETFTVLGPMSRSIFPNGIEDEWFRLFDLSPEPIEPFFLRVSAPVASGAGNASTGRVLFTQRFLGRGEVIFSDRFSVP